MEYPTAEHDQGCDAVDATRQLVTDKEMLMTVNMPEKVATITGDRDQLIQAMVNLVSNAVKFCAPRTGQIQISLHQRYNKLHIGVADNGIGISEANIVDLQAITLEQAIRRETEHDL